MWKKEQEPEVQHPCRQQCEEQREEQQREKSNRQRKQPSSKKPDEVKDLAEMMKDLKIFQLEKQLTELAKVNQRNRQQINQDQQVEKGQNLKALPFCLPNQYGNRYYPNVMVHITKRTDVGTLMLLLVMLPVQALRVQL